MCQPSPYHPTELACGWESAMTTIEGRGESRTVGGVCCLEFNGIFGVCQMWVVIHGGLYVDYRGPACQNMTLKKC